MRNALWLHGEVLFLQAILLAAREHPYASAYTDSTLALLLLVHYATVAIVLLKGPSIDRFVLYTFATDLFQIDEEQRNLHAILHSSLRLSETQQANNKAR